MNNTSATRLRMAALVIALGAVTALALAGCVSTPKSTASARPTPSASSTPSATPVPTATPSPTASVSPSTATHIPCGTLLSPDAVYTFNANFSLDAGFTPKSGTAAATAVADSGTACNWTNQTSGDTFTVSVARPAAPEFAAVKTKAAAGTPASGLGDAAYFSTSGGSGRVDVFRGAYWLVATSVYFGSAADAKDLVTSALSALK